MPNRQELASQLSRLGLALQATSGSPTIANRAQTSLDRLGQNDARLLEQQLQNEAALGLSRERSETDFQNRLFLQDRRADQTQRNAFKNKLIDLTFGAVKDNYDMLGELANSPDTDPEMKPAIRKQRDEMGQLLFNPQNMEKFVDGLSQDRELMESLLQTPEGGGALATKGSGSEIVNQNTGEVVSAAKAAPGGGSSGRVTENVLTPEFDVISGDRNRPEIQDALNRGGVAIPKGDSFDVVIQKRHEKEVDKVIDEQARIAGIPDDAPDKIRQLADLGKLGALQKILGRDVARRVRSREIDAAEGRKINLAIKSKMGGLRNLARSIKDSEEIYSDNPAAFTPGKKLPSRVLTFMGNALKNIWSDTDREEHKELLTNPEWLGQIRSIVGDERRAQEMVMGMAVSYARAMGMVTPDTGRITVDGMRRAIAQFDPSTFSGDILTYRRGMNTLLSQVHGFVRSDIETELGVFRDVDPTVDFDGTGADAPPLKPAGRLRQAFGVDPGG